MSPEQLLTPEFREVLRTSSFRATIIDETHCIAMWSAFRFEYSRIHTIRTLLPVDSVVFTCAATLNLVLEKQIFEDGGFGRGHSWDSNVAYEP